MYTRTPVAEPSTFYKTFSEKKLTGYGSSRRGRIERHRLGLLHRFAPAPGDMVEVGPGHGSLAEQAVDAGWRYTAIEASPILIEVLRGKGLTVIESWAPPIPVPGASADVVYADQVLEHMSGIDAARQFTAEALRALRPGGVFFVVVPDYLKERTFFWDVDYTHNFVTTERRVRQLLNDGGFEILHLERAIGLATGVGRAPQAPGARRVSVPGGGARSRDPRAPGAAVAHPGGFPHPHPRAPQGAPPGGGPRRPGRRRAAGERARRGRALALHRHRGAAIQDPQEPVRDAHLRGAEAGGRRPLIAVRTLLGRASRSTALRLVVTAVILAYLSRRIDMAASARAMAAMSLPHLAVVLALVAVDRALMVLRWVLLLRASGVAVPAPEAARIFLVSSFVGSFLPAGVGGPPPPPNPPPPHPPRPARRGGGGGGGAGGGPSVGGGGWGGAAPPRGGGAPPPPAPTASPPTLAAARRWRRSPWIACWASSPSSP